VAPLVDLAWFLLLLLTFRVALHDARRGVRPFERLKD